MKKILSKYYIEIGLVFIVVFGVFFALEFNDNNPYFSGYDSFYHVGMAEHIMQSGLPHQFPYLQFTTLNANFTDNHLLFHLLLIPFIKIFGEVTGPKVFHYFMLFLNIHPSLHHSAKVKVCLGPAVHRYRVSPRAFRLLFSPSVCQGSHPVTLFLGSCAVVSYR